MLPVISALLACVAGLFRSRASLHLEHLALRHQLAVYQHTMQRPRLRPTDRLFWAWLSRRWSGWQSPLAFVQPRTVMAWQRQRFRDHWQQLSRQGMPGRPPIAKEVRDLIRTMWQANPTWGAPRIVGELRKLGIEVAKSTVETYRVGMVKLTAERKNTLYSAGISSGSEALTSHFGVKTGPKTTSTSHSTTLFCRSNR